MKYLFVCLAVFSLAMNAAANECGCLAIAKGEMETLIKKLLSLPPEYLITTSAEEYMKNLTPSEMKAYIYGRSDSLMSLINKLEDYQDLQSEES